MSVVTNSITVRAAIGWRLSKANTGLDATTQGPNGQTGTFAPATATYNRIYALASTTIAAAATQDLDFNSFTDLVGTAQTATKIIGFLITATATVTGGILEVKPHPTTNPLNWPMGSGDAITLTVGTTGAGLMAWQGTTQTLSTTARAWRLTNTGTQTITVTVSAVVGT